MIARVIMGWSCSEHSTYHATPLINTDPRDLLLRLEIRRHASAGRGVTGGWTKGTVYEWSRWAAVGGKPETWRSVHHVKNFLNPSRDAAKEGPGSGGEKSGEAN